MVKILTHGGNAHVDEVIAIALISIAEEQEVHIERAYPSEETDYSNYDFVVDVGRRFDGEKFFDHHQNTPETEGKSATTLVVEEYFPGVLEAGLVNELSGLFERIGMQDTKGLTKTRKKYENEEVKPFMTLEFGLVEEFKTNPNFIVNRVIVPILKRALNFREEVIKASEFLKKNSEILEVKGSVKALKITKEFDGGYKAFNKAQTNIIDENDISVVYNYDNGSDGRVLFRTSFGEKVGIDLTKVNPESPIFIHKAGFLAKFHPSSKGEFLELIEESLK